MKKRTIILIFSLFFVLVFSQNAFAAEEKKLLLVYDSLNIAGEKQADIDSLQRLLTTMGAEVVTTTDNTYVAGELNDNQFYGVISFVNWDEKGLQSNVFEDDRKQFTGKKLHIGLDIAEDEKSGFEGTWRALSHRQFTLIHEEKNYQELLDYQDQSLVLETNIGTRFGVLTSQELDEKEYPFGVIQGKNGFLPMYSHSGAVFLQASELIHRWLEGTKTYQPMLTFNQMNPLIDMETAEWFEEELADLADYYAVSTTSVNQNSEVLSFKRFTDLLRKMQTQQSAAVFLSVPAVNAANTSDNRILGQLMNQQISLLVGQNVFPIGVSAPGYWNQDADYQADALAIANSVILEENPHDEAIFYRVQTNQSKIYDTAFYSLADSELDGIEWLTNSQYTDYKFSMPVSYGYTFPKTKKEGQQLLDKLNASFLNFTHPFDTQYTYSIETQTQLIEIKNGQLLLNRVPVEELTTIKDTEIPSVSTDGLFSTFYNLTNNLLISIIVITIVILIILFIRGRRNYRAKFIRSERGKKK